MIDLAAMVQGMAAMVQGICFSVPFVGWEDRWAVSGWKEYLGEMASASSRGRCG